MNNETLLDSIGLLDEQFLAEHLEAQPKQLHLHRRIWYGIVAAVLAITFVGCVFATVIQPKPTPSWEAYQEADTLLDILFGTHRYSLGEGEYHIRHIWSGDKETGNLQLEEVRIPVTSSASRDPVIDELAALVEPFLIPVEKTVSDPTGTMTLEVMAYLYEPETQCGMIYMRLTDPTGDFGGYVPERASVTNAGDELPEAEKKPLTTFLGLYKRRWSRNQPDFNMTSLRFVKEYSDETTWTLIVYFQSNEDIVDFDVGFRTEPMVDYRPYQVDIDLEISPTMKTICLGNAGNREIVTLSPVSMRTDGTEYRYPQSDKTKIVIHYDDGTSYVVVDEEACVYGCVRTSTNTFVFSNIIDLQRVEAVEIDGVRYVIVSW